MVTSSTKVLATSRIVALALIGLVAVGLVYLRFASDPDRVSMPPGAEAGDLTLEDCVYDTEQGQYQADCGTLIVAETESDPDSRLIALPVIRIPAQSDNPDEPIFRLEGGPGQTNMNFPQASRYTNNHDLVLVGYRGVDGSVRLDCPEVVSALQQSTDLLAEESLEGYGNGLRSCADRLTAQGVDLASYGLIQQVDDLEAARVAFGYDRINLLSESAGTRTAMIYGWRFPESIHRSVMAGVNPPGHFVFYAETADEQIARYAELCAEDPTCRQRTGDLAASMTPTAANMPERWLFLPIKRGNVLATSFTAMMQSTVETGIGSAPAVFDAWISAAEGDASGLWVMSVLADLFSPRTFVWGQYAAAAHIDAQAAHDYLSSNDPDLGTNLGRAASTYSWAGGRVLDAWPSARHEEEYLRMRESEVETLLIGGELDTSTPPQVATEKALPYLPHGEEVILSGISHSPSFWYDQPEAGTRLILTFFDNGRVDDTLYRPQPVNFTPPTTLGAVAKMTLAVIVGLAVLVVLSLLVMARRVYTRGRIGPVSGGLLRSVYPVVLGLGGWCLGALVALAAMPGVHVDNEPLIVISVAVPVGLGIYLAWVSRDWTSRRKSAGLAAAAVAALAGAWLGFHATQGLLASLTAIIGAIVATNLIVIGLDITRVQSARRFAVPSLTVDEEVEHVRI